MNYRGRLTGVSRAAGLAAMLAGGLQPGPGLAQTSIGRAETPDAPSALEEITVTARRREESLQLTPIAVTALSADALQERGITQLSDIEQAAPSLTLRGSAPISGNPTAISAFIRGIGQVDFSANTDPGVGIYVDGVYIARSVGGLLNLVDVERVEVLRGPQGTLFGRNTIGGAINIVSRPPSRTPDAYVTLTTGSDHRVMIQATADLPVSDTIFTQFSLLRHQRDGYVRRLQPGLTDLGDDDDWDGRTQILWQPGERFSARLAVDANRTRDDGSGNVPIAISSQGGGGTSFPPGGIKSLFNTLIVGPPCDAAHVSTWDSNPSCYGGAWATHNPYATNSTYPARADTDVIGTALTLEWQFGPTTLKSISAYRNLNSTFGRDADATPFNLVFTYATLDQHQWSQELQLLGDSLSRRLHWVGGLYYFQEVAHEFDLPGGDLFQIDETSAIHNENYASFGEVTYDLTPRLHLTGGLRWTRETKKVAEDDIVVGGILLPIGSSLVADTSEQSQTANRVTPRVTLAANITDQLMSYLTYSQGFKSGGFNFRFTSPVAAPIPFRPETVTLYEAGVKFQSEDNTWRINSALFYSDYKDIQIQRKIAPNSNLGDITDNAAAGAIKGAELESTWLPISALQFDAGVTYLDAKLTKVTPAVIAGGIPPDAQFVLTPRWAGDLSVSYKARLGNSGARLTPRLDWSYRSKFFMNSSNTPELLQRPYGVLNAAIALDTSNPLWRITAGVTNLTDKHYLISGTASPSQGLAEGVYARPREWFLSVRRDF